MKILWVEDNLDEVIAIVTGLLSTGHVITIVGSHQKAIERLESGEVWDLIVLDSFVPTDGPRPAHSGCDLFIELRRGKWGSWGCGVRVLFITGYAPIVWQNIRGVTPAPVDVLGKPIGANAALDQMHKSVSGLSISAHDTSRVEVIIQQNSQGDSAHAQTIHQTTLPLSKADLAVLRNIATQWIARGDDSALEAAQKVVEILQSADRLGEQEEKVRSFQRYLSSKGDEVKEGLRTSAAIVTAATPILKLLGLL